MKKNNITLILLKITNKIGASHSETKNKHLHNVRLTRCEPKEEQKTTNFTEEAYTFEAVGNYAVTLFDANAKSFLSNVIEIYKFDIGCS
jgi:hypothetical protein